MKRAALLLFVMLACSASAEPARRALLIGIDDYTASTLPATSAVTLRGWNDLRGAANDVRILAGMLELRYGFARKDIVTLTNQQATRAAIMRAIDEQLVRPARRGDVVFFYFAGHGAQVPNADSDEPDKLDESIVPADSRRGAADIRDKQLRPLFNRILASGARLTILVDACHAAGGFRGLPDGSHPRGIAPAPAIRDATNYGPRPDERGAFVVAAAQDFEDADEAHGDDDLWHGAFTWAWIGAMRDAAAGEPASETFLRAQARLRGERAYQTPVMLGTRDALQRPFLGGTTTRRGARIAIAVERVISNQQIVVQGGWAHGLAADAELSPLDDPRTRIRVTRILGLGRSEARLQSTHPGSIVHAGTLLTVVRWTAPQQQPLHVYVPRVAANVRALAQRFAAATKARWVTDPLDETPTHVLQPRARGWQLVGRNGTAIALDDDAAMTAVAHLRPSDSLFVQLPPREAMAGADGVAIVDDARDADYMLAGRLRGTRVEYAWIRPRMRNADARALALPAQTAWTEDAMQLRENLITLRRIQAWMSLQSPADTRAPYRLALQDDQAKHLVAGTTLTGRHIYSVVLRATRATPAKRYYYVFVVDDDGNSHLVFPTTGSTENRFPLKDRAPDEIVIGAPSAFRVVPPYGTDTYFLLSTEEALPDPSILEWDGVRAPRAFPPTPWAIERITFVSDAPVRRRSKAAPAAPRRR